MTAGRPNKYTPDAIITSNKYLREAIPKNMDMPTVEGLALELGL
jgi:hypothetical protein